VLIEAFLIVSGPGPGLQWKGRSWGGSRTRGEEAEERSHRSPLYGSRTGCGLAAESRKWPPKKSQIESLRPIAAVHLPGIV